MVEITNKNRRQDINRNVVHAGNTVSWWNTEMNYEGVIVGVNYEYRIWQFSLNFNNFIENLY